MTASNYFLSMASCKFFLNFHTMISLVTALNCTLLQGSILVGWATRTLGSSPRRSSPSSRRPSSTTRRTWSSWSRYRQDINCCLFSHSSGSVFSGLLDPNSEYIRIRTIPRKCQNLQNSISQLEEASFDF